MDKDNEFVEEVRYTCGWFFMSKDFDQYLHGYAKIFDPTMSLTNPLKEGIFIEGELAEDD